MAYFPAHILDSAAKCRDRVQGDAGVAAAFFLPVNVGRLHAGSYSGEACSASGRGVTGLFVRREWTVTLCRTGNRWYIATITNDEEIEIIAALKRAQKGRETCPFCALDGFN